MVEQAKEIEAAKIKGKCKGPASTSGKVDQVMPKALESQHRKAIASGRTRVHPILSAGLA